jgi:hypothetical protein
MISDLKLIHSNHFLLGERDAMVFGVMKQELSETRRKEERTMFNLDWYIQK